MSTGQYALAVLFFIIGVLCALVMARKFMRVSCNILFFMVFVGSCFLMSRIISNPNISLVWKYVAHAVNGCFICFLGAVHGLVDDFGPLSRGSIRC